MRRWGLVAGTLAARAEAKHCMRYVNLSHVTTAHPHDVLGLRAGIHALRRVLLQPCKSGGGGGG